MRWKKFTIKTTTNAVDFLSDLLNDLGIEGIEIEDNVPLTGKDTKGMFIDILPELDEDDGSARVSFYLDEAEDSESVLLQVNEGIESLRIFIDMGEGTIEESLTEDKDWINNWKEFFKPFVIDDILVKPVWEEIPEAHRDKLLIEIDPGTAFGTGTHETTQLCIRGISKYIKRGDLVLDVGTGSGILGICALKKGAEEVTGTDLDEAAIKAARENSRANGITVSQFKLFEGNLIDQAWLQGEVGFERYDLVVANILAPVIIELQRMIVPHMKPGGIFLASGILNTKEAEVKAALAANEGLKILDTVHQGEWVSIAAIKNRQHQE